MQTLLIRLWNDDVGSSISAEMGLVTSVTIGALFMGMSQFGQSVNKSFENATVMTDVMTDEELEEQERREEFLKKKRQRRLDAKMRADRKRVAEQELDADGAGE